MGTVVKHCPGTLKVFAPTRERTDAVGSQSPSETSLANPLAKLLGRKTHNWQIKNTVKAIRGH